MASRKSISAADLPEGFGYVRDFLSPQEEAGLLQQFAELPFRAFEFQGFVAKRRIADYGWEYDFTSRQASVTRPLPDFLLPLRERAAAAAGVPGDDLVEAIVTEYPPGAPIGWHRDVPQFEVVLGISLGSAARMRFKPYRGVGKIASQTLEPRSLYVMRGSARWEYQHSIPPVTALRYSITFRTLRAKRSPKSAA